jgi:GNAT superfamily N-acetyltransferase
MISEYLDSEKVFIFNSWLKNYQAQSYFARDIERDVFFKYHHLIIENILLRPTTKLFIKRDDNFNIQGWICGEPSLGIIHYIYVRPEYRLKKIGSKLFHHLDIKDDYILTTHHTCGLSQVQQKKLALKERLIYNPYRL